MKEIKAFIKPGKVQKVVSALGENGFENITVSMAEGTGWYKRRLPHGSHAPEPIADILPPTPAGMASNSH